MKKVTLLLGAILSLSTSMQAFAGNQDYIVGGVDVQAGDPVVGSTVLIVGETVASPTTAAARTKDAAAKASAPSSGVEEYICSGSLIAPDMVVTAAHCVAEDLNNPTDPTKLWVIFSLTIPSSIQDPSVHTVSNYEFNPGWQGLNSQGADEHDIAVIHINGSLPSGYAPATLLDPSVALTAGTNVTLAGYGIDKGTDKTGKSAGTLRKVDVTVEGSLGQTEVILNQYDGKGACHGDSGGPAFLTVNGQLYLWGVTNRGYPDNAPDNCKSESVYTRITDYNSFIEGAEDKLRK